MHAVQLLYQYRKSISTKEFGARGKKVKRCEMCRIGLTHCICHLVPKTTSNAAFLLLMHDSEVLKPSNTGRLIADLFPDTFAYLWSRTTIDPALVRLLQDPQWQPYVVFPAQYAEPGRDIFQQQVQPREGKRPLFILLDGSWREAKKMFRKSPYLADFPMVSFTPDAELDEALSSRFVLRNAEAKNQFATAEVAARVLAMTGEQVNAQLLDLWFDVFSNQYQSGVSKLKKGNMNSIEHLTDFVTLHGLSQTA